MTPTVQISLATSPRREVSRRQIGVVMHIILAILGLAAAGAFWWYRLRAMGDVARDAADQVGKVRGHFRRKGMQKKANLSPITAIDDPVIAAATLITAISGEDRHLTKEAQELISRELEPIADSPEKLVEATTYAKWAVDQIDDASVVIDRLTAFLAPKLTGTEKEQLVAMTEAAIPKSDRGPLYHNRIDRLRRKLGLIGSQ